MSDEKEQPEQLKGARYEGLCYMVKHNGAKPLISCVKGKKPKKIYEDRGYTEVSKEEYDKLHAEIRASWAK